MKQMNSTLYHYSFFISFILCINSLHCYEVDGINETLIKLSQTIQILSKAGYSIEQIHESGNYLIATKYRTDSCKLSIKTFDNKSLHFEEFKNPFQVLSGGPGGFCWLRKSPTKKIYCYRLSTQCKYTWILNHGVAQDMRLMEKGDLLYYKHSSPMEDNSQCGILYCSYQNILWQTISHYHWVRYLNDSFIKYQFTNKSNNYLIMNSDDSCSALLILENQRSEIFGNNCYTVANTAAINSKKTQFCIRKQNLLLHYDLVNKKNTVFKVECTENIEKDDSIRFFIFSPCENYIYVFFDNYLRAYHIKDNEVENYELPQPFKAIHDLREPACLLFQSKKDRLFRINRNPKQIEFILV